MTQAISSGPSTVGNPRTTEIGLALVGTSVFAFATLPILVKLGFQEGLGVWQLLLLRSALGGAGLMALVWFLEGATTLRRTLTVRTMLTGLLFCVNSVLFFWSLRYVSASLAVLLLFIHPPFVAFAKRILANEVPDRATQIALVATADISSLVRSATRRNAA